MKKIILSIVTTTMIYGQIIGGVAVTVEGEAITIYDIQKEMALSKTSSSQATQSLIRKKLEFIEIENRDISISPSDVYKEIKLNASKNNMSVSQFYASALSSNNLTSDELKKRVKENLERKKLYSSIAYSLLKEPTTRELKAYYELHKDMFSNPSSFSAIIYQSPDSALLQQKVSNPMFYSPSIAQTPQEIKYSQVPPELGKLLSKTPVGTFSQIVPDGQGSFISFYIKDVVIDSEKSYESSTNQITNIIMNKKREQVLTDYFARLRVNADVKVIRVPNN